MKTFDDFKTEINLVDFCLRHGYVINKNSSTKSAKVMQKLDLNGESIETVIVRINTDSGQYVYSNPNNRFDKGSIIDFVFNKITSGDVKETNILLNNYLGDALTDVNYYDDLKLIKKSKSKVRSTFDLLPLTDFSYLTSRGLSQKTILAPQFKNRIFNHKVQTKEGREFLNIAFPMYNESGLSGAEIRNYKMKGSLENSSNIDSVWISNFDKTKPVDYVFFGEAVIDMLSFFQLFQKGEENNIYVGSLGYWTVQQLELCKSLLIDKYKPKQVVLINDNDLNGILYNINLAGQLLHKEGRAEAILDNQHLELRLYELSDTQLGLFSEKLKEFSLVPVNFRANNDSRIFAFGKRDAQLKFLDVLVIEVLGLSNNIKIIRPKHKDFNEDLTKP